MSAVKAGGRCRDYYSYSFEKSTLVSRGGRVYRCISSGNGRVQVIVAGKQTSMSLMRVKPLPVVRNYWQSFDEWPGMPEDMKRFFIRSAHFSNPRLSWQDGAADKISANLTVFDFAVSETAATIRAGWAHYSMRTILEVARHNTRLSMLDRDFKINNNLAPDFARMMTCLFPEVPKGFFEFRRSAIRETAA